MKRIIFKIIAVSLVFTHLSQICFRDVAFAKNSSSKQPAATVSKTSSSGSPTAKPPESTSNSGTTTSASKSISYLPPQQVVGDTGFNVNALKALQNDPFTGRATYSVPISVPTGRKNIQPNIALTYASGGGNSIIGLGWSLDLGTIERSTKRGAPKYDSSDTFIYNPGSSSSELVNVAGNEYRAKIEGGFLRFIFTGAYWIVTDKSGIKYYFGQTSASRQEDGMRVAKWYLDKIVDLDTNYLTVAYYKDSNQLYPQEINYTGNESAKSAAAYSVKFIIENRPDSTQVYREGMPRYLSKRISGIEIKYNDSLIRKYKLNYISEPVANRSLLSSVVLYGRDGTNSLPAVTFEYQQEATGWQDSQASLPAAGFDQTTRIFDINDDGFPDIANNSSVYSGRKNLAWEQTASSMPPINLSAAQVADVDGDGWLDITHHSHGHYCDCGHCDQGVYINNHNNGWYLDPDWSARIPTSPDDSWFVYFNAGDSHISYNGRTMVDVNGDGFADIVAAREGDRFTYINTQDKMRGWIKDPTWAMPTGDLSDGTTVFCELNGDGLADFFKIDGANSFGYVNTGKGWAQDNRYTINLSSYPREAIQLIDVNSDGLSDVVIANDATKETFINTPRNSQAACVWEKRQEYAFPSGAFSWQSARIADGRAMATADILINDGSTRKIHIARNSVPAGLLTKVSNGLGGEIRIAYKPSTEFDNKDDAGVYGLPFPIYVVATITNHDRANPANPDITTSYSYAKGKFNFIEREFRGFGLVKSIDSTGNSSETAFLQDDDFKGRPSAQMAKDAQGQLLTKSENTWQVKELYPKVKFPYLAQTDSYVYDNSRNFKQTRTKFDEYDDYGNLKKVTSFGDVDLATDQKTQNHRIRSCQYG